MPAMGGRGGGGLMVPRGGMGRRSSCYPGGSGGGIPPSVHKAGRRASSRSEAGIGLFPGLLGGGGKNQVIVQNISGIQKILLSSNYSRLSIYYRVQKDMNISIISYKTFHS